MKRLMNVVEQILDAGHMNTELLGELRSAYESTPATEQEPRVYLSPKLRAFMDELESTPEGRAMLVAADREVRGLPPLAAEPLTDAARDVLAERHRQISVEGWTPEHDDMYRTAELAAAAATYALCERPEQLKVCGIVAWPWPRHWWKPTGYRRNLVKAGALILAEIERLDRAASTKGDKQ